MEWLVGLLTFALQLKIIVLWGRKLIIGINIIINKIKYSFIITLRQNVRESQ